MNLSISLPKDIVEALRQQAWQERLPVSAVIRRALVRDLKIKAKAGSATCATGKAAK